MTKKTMIAGLLVASALAAGGWYLFGRSGSSTETTGEKHVVKRGSLVEKAMASGTVEPHVQVEVKSRGSGTVVEVLVDEGQSVEAGALLFKLDPVDAERAVREAKTTMQRVQADVAQARAALLGAEIDRGSSERSSSLAERGQERGLVTEDTTLSRRASAQGAQATVSLRRAQLAAATASLEAARLAVDEAERRLGEMQIYAPISGTVLSVTVERGSIVSSALTNIGGGSALATIADLSDLRIVGAIDEAQIGRVKLEQKAEIRVDAYPDIVFAGKVIRVSPLGRVLSNVVSFDVEIVVEDAQKNLLRSGMSADLEIETSREQNVVLVPLLAVRSVGSVRKVMLANREERVIKTGASDGDSLAVLEGLREGDTILIGAESDASARTPAKGLFQMGRPSGGAKRPR